MRYDAVELWFDLVMDLASSLPPNASPALVRVDHVTSTYASNGSKPHIKKRCPAPPLSH